MLKYLILIIAIGFLYESVSWIFRLFFTYSWIKKERKNYRALPSDKQKIYILIPVLAEADILEDTVRYFNTHFTTGRSDTFLVIITTEKEDLVTQSKQNTISIARNITQQDSKIIHIHFPEKEGKMAHQLNYAIGELTNKSNVIRDGDLIAVYNADSRPEKETLDWVRKEFREKNIQAFQQYGCYTGNILRLQNLSWKSILVSASIWQTRWAIGFELFNALKQLRFVKKNLVIKFNYPFNYCIGHGLFITPKLFQKVGGFSESTHNEDAILGLQLSNMQELLMPVPYFDISESPDSVTMLYKQKSNWYFGPLQAYTYAVDILKNSDHNFFGKVRLFLLSSKLFSHAVFWIVGPSAAFMVCILALIKHDFSLLLIGFLSIIAFSIPSVISYVFIIRLGVTRSSIKMTKMVGMSTLGFFAFYLLHGASAYRGLVKYIKQVTSGKATIKEKTVMKRS
ncbi:MAG: hypothetical protein COV34_00090 [Candidatus Zambryskibacteria bacterium CG10_big_fil_rev_8_21_14_0_10_42_12]|uniref:Glycosyltransferase 2-like domain-containing protein n=1 Tax=Candidatus Zambryskibacteria bacterium CG10_big_fil_rev_8_21_14_0_10_42_12 TaxID=1975115 RepID=A0A2H0QXF2_9BACT|nr:MAG: hypothetical protein COV34_00090 [Candidatus Zambryskibacteria bacterium CG10_big_fil_rev_8_21_14_0_10_42_12]